MSVYKKAQPQCPTVPKTHLPSPERDTFAEGLGEARVHPVGLAKLGRLVSNSVPANGEPCAISEKRARLHSTSYCRKLQLILKHGPEEDEADAKLQDHLDCHALFRS